MTTRNQLGGRVVKKHLLAACVAIMTVCSPGSAPAYQQYSVNVGNRSVVLKWQQLPIRYYVTDAGTTGVGADDLRDAVERAFSTWQAVRTSSARATFAGFTTATAGDDDGQSTLGFENRPDLDRVLGATTFLIDTVTGEIVESDIFFNSFFGWSVAAEGQAGLYDLESIALHEIGHFFGLGHSGLGETEIAGTGRRVLAAEAVMFPIAFSAGNVTGRTLRPDDIAGISDLYPSVSFRDTTAIIAGRVTKDSQPVYGAHVVAFNVTTGRLIGNLSYDAGRFAIAGLEPGAYLLRVEPLDDASLESFFDDAAAVELDFRVTFFERLVPAPVGGSSGQVTVLVQSK